MEKRNIGREGIIDDTKPLLFDKKFQELKNNEVEMQKDMKGFYARISKDKEQGHSTVSSVNMDSFKKKVAEIKQGLPQNQPVEKKKSNISIGM